MTHDNLKPFSLNLRGRLFTIREPLVMGIVNVTPDSFYAGSRVSPDYIASRVSHMLEECASIIDIGAYSTRPGASDISEDEEWHRLAKSLEAIRRRHPQAILSVDTFRSRIARLCVEEFGVDIINDVSGGNHDPEMFATVADLHVPYVLMHSTGTPASSKGTPRYKDVVAEVLSDLAFKDAQLRRLGVADVIIDPGFGFGKDLEQNFRLLNSLELFHNIERPLLVGISRKSMISRALGCVPAEALNGTTVLNTVALRKGAHILRVHDVKEASEIIRLLSLLSP